jgi:Zn-finger nucleic acid-binding protein
MSQKTISDVVLDVCDGGCGGIWFDKNEFKKFDESIEPDADALVTLKVTKKPTLPSPYTCPRCAPVKLFRHFSSVKRKIAIDDCPKCTGVWLDVGELTQIRAEFNTEAERRAAAEKIYTELVEQQTATLHAQSQQNLARAKKFASALRFICPSYYIPGKQDGGAF